MGTFEEWRGEMMDTCRKMTQLLGENEQGMTTWWGFLEELKDRMRDLVENDPPDHNKCCYEHGCDLGEDSCPAVTDPTRLCTDCAVGMGGNMSKGCSLRELVAKHGFDIHVQSTDTNCRSFTIVSEDDEFKYNVRYDDGRTSSVLKECPNTNDYYLAPDIKE